MVLTDDDKNMINYFITERNDITRWCHWEKKKAEVEAELPELIDALKRLEIAEKTLDAVVKSIFD